MDWIAKKYSVKKGYEMHNKDEDLFKVTIIHLEQDKYYALVVSLSHVVGDGHSFYRIYAMLSKPNQVCALNPIRDF
jgi:hypothetical protein